MAIFAAGITKDVVTKYAQSRLAALRAALNDSRDFYLWLSAYSSSDLVALGFTQADADDIFSAMADANALNEYYINGAPPGTYPQPASNYVYSNSQRIVIGPLS